MSWTATLVSASRADRTIQATVHFENAALGLAFDQVIPGDNLDMTRLSLFCKDIIDNLQKRDAAFDKLVPGPIKLPEEYKVA